MINPVLVSLLILRHVRAVHKYIVLKFEIWFDFSHQTITIFNSQHDSFILVSPQLARQTLKLRIALKDNFYINVKRSIRDRQWRC